MKTIRRTIPAMTIEQFADQHDLTLQIVERKLDVGNPMRYYACFERAEIKESIFLVGCFGNGVTEQQAIDNYAREIEMRTLVINSTGNDRRQIEVPRLTTI